MLARWKGVSAGKPLDGECEVWPTSGDPQARLYLYISSWYYWSLVCVHSFHTWSQVRFVT